MRYSLPELLAAVYKDIEWDRQRFKEGKRINRERKLQAKLTAIEAKMGIQEVGWFHLLIFCNLIEIQSYQPQDWYTVRLSDLHDMGFPRKVTMLALAELLRERYPDHQWLQFHLRQGRYALQKRLERAVSALFPVILSLSGLSNPLLFNR